jgi:uncharacterized membrane protein
MESRKYLKTIFIISLIGVLFSGYLSYIEFTTKTCSLGGCTSLFGMPACVFGFAFYFIIMIISFAGMKKNEI